MRKALLLLVVPALALALAGGGKRVLVVEVEGRQGLAQMFDVPPLPYEERRVAVATGGGEVFALCLPRATHLHLTHVDTIVEGADAFFPVFDAAQWRILARESHPADAKHAFAFEFVDYEFVERAG